MSTIAEIIETVRSYAPDADGWVVLDTDLSGLSSPTELAFRAHWDMEGGWQDSMTTLLSLDQGTSWISLSQSPGLPGNGVLWQGSWLTQESGEWVDIGYSLPPAVFTSANASSAQLAFSDLQGLEGWSLDFGWACERILQRNMRLRQRCDLAPRPSARLFLPKS